jgi:hypothetical protein
MESGSGEELRRRVIRELVDLEVVAAPRRSSRASGSCAGFDVAEPASLTRPGR